MNTNFSKFYLTAPLTSMLDTNGVEKKHVTGVVPPKWQYVDPKVRKTGFKDNGFGNGVHTGKLSNIVVIDCDNMESYEVLCRAYDKLHEHYTVKTRKGYHVYFLYDKDIKSFDNDTYGTRIDLQSDGKFVFGEGTTLYRYDGTTTDYTYTHGKIKKMPIQIRNMCKMHNDDHMLEQFTSNSTYSYEIDDDTLRNILDQIEEKFPKYFTEYNDWLVYTTIMKTMGAQAIWDEYNKMYDNYNAVANMRTWNSIKVNISINFFCKLLKIPYVRFHKVSGETVLSNNIKIDEMDSNYVTIEYDELYNYDTLILESKTGTGKTTAVSKLSKIYLTLNPGYSILSIVNLISLADQQCETFRKSGVELLNYNDESNASILMMKNSVICINSLHKLATCDFSNKIVYIDEIHALTKSLTHNTTLKFQKLVYNTLERMIRDCYKLIVSDAHILQNTMWLLDERLNDKTKPVRYYRNAFNKFQDVDAIQYKDENTFYEKMEQAVLNGENFTFCCDSKKIATDWFNYLYEIAPMDVQEKMLLFTSDTDTELCKDWKNKIVVYSPKISCGVDITIKSEQTTQYVYVTGKSVDPIQLYQMSTRTRNMKEMNFYSSCVSKVAQYEDVHECEVKKVAEFKMNVLGLSSIDYDRDVPTLATETRFMRMYCENEFQKDHYGTNVEHFFKEELANAGFNVIDYEDEVQGLNDETKEKIREIMEQIVEEKYTKLIETVELIDETTAVDSDIKNMVGRVKILNITDKNIVEEYRSVIEDEYIFEHFMNYGRLNTSYDHCQYKLTETVKNKMLNGIHNNVWNKIMYMYKLMKVCKMDNILDISNIQMPEMTEDVVKLITCIKVLYNKRDNVKAERYVHKNIVQLYVFMLNNLTKKIGIVKSTKSNKRDEIRDERIYSINEENKAKYDKLLHIMRSKTSGQSLTEDELVTLFKDD